VGQHLNTTGNDWAKGNFNYSPNGTVDFNDLFIIGQNLNQTLNGASMPQAQSVFVLSAVVAVPEPNIFGLASVYAASLLLRRRNSLKSA
jgi:hypothetical protein